MKPFNLLAGKPASVIAVALLGAASLVGCGSGTYHPAPEPEPPAPAVDAFFAAVSTLVATSPDDAEPVATESNVATAPEDSEPKPLG